MAVPFQNLPEQRQLLDAIAGGESPGYDVLYGGGRFQGYADHPRQAIPITTGPNAGKTSSAAGRYQFLGPTWDQVAKEAGLKDFSPDNQDAGAWHLAAQTYESKTGRDLLTDIKEGRTQDIAPSLSGVWTSIPGGIEPNKATGGFLDRLGSPTEVASLPVAAPAPDAPASAPVDQPQSPGLFSQLEPSQQRGGGLFNFTDPLAQQFAQQFAQQQIPMPKRRSSLLQRYG